MIRGRRARASDAPRAAAARAVVPPRRGRRPAAARARAVGRRPRGRRGADAAPDAAAAARRDADASTSSSSGSAPPRARRSSWRSSCSRRTGLLVEGPDAPRAREPRPAVAAAYDLAPAVAAERLGGARIGVVGRSPAGVDDRAAASRGRGRRGRPPARGGLDARSTSPSSPRRRPRSTRLPGWNLLALERGVRWLPVRAVRRPVRRRRAAHRPRRVVLLRVPAAPRSAQPRVRRPISPRSRRRRSRRARTRRSTRSWSPWPRSSPSAGSAVATRPLPGVLYVLETRPALALSTHPVLRVPRCPACSEAATLAPPTSLARAEAA